MECVGNGPVVVDGLPVPRQLVGSRVVQPAGDHEAVGRDLDVPAGALRARDDQRGITGLGMEMRLGSYVDSLKSVLDEALDQAAACVRERAA